MYNFQGDRVECGDALIGLVVVSRVRILREYIARYLSATAGIDVLASCATLDEAVDIVAKYAPQMVLLDSALPHERCMTARLREVSPAVKCVVIAMRETEDDIFGWAEAGMTGYVPDTASVDELPNLLRNIQRGEQHCSSRISGSLLHWIGRAAGDIEPPAGRSAVPLTPRERVILRHLGAGLTNKDIARQLDISVGTAKSHVHNIFAKLQLRRRSQVAAHVSARPGA